MNYILLKIFKGEFTDEDKKFLSPKDLEICMDVQNRVLNKRKCKNDRKKEFNKNKMFISQSARYQSPTDLPMKATRNVNL
jgi:hypothetical protein